MDICHVRALSHPHVVVRAEVEVAKLAVQPRGLIRSDHLICNAGKVSWPSLQVGPEDPTDKSSLHHSLRPFDHGVSLECPVQTLHVSRFLSSWPLWTGKAPGLVGAIVKRMSTQSTFSEQWRWVHHVQECFTVYQSMLHRNHIGGAAGGLRESEPPPCGHKCGAPVQRNREPMCSHCPCLCADAPFTLVFLETGFIGFHFLRASLITVKGVLCCISLQS